MGQPQDCVLVVDDHEDTVRVLLRLLGMLGYSAHGASTVGEALTLARQYGCRVLVSDLSLSDGSGMDLLRTLRESGRIVHGVAVTGHDDDVLRQAARAAGFQRHLVKPVSFDQLLNALTAVQN